MGFEKIPLILLIVRIAAAGTVELGPAGPAGFLVINRSAGKAFFLSKIVFPCQHISHLPFRLADELMAGENTAFRIHGRVFIAAAAASQPFDGTGPLIQIEHKMEKVEVLSPAFHIQNGAGQPVIFFANRRQILLPQGLRHIGIRDNRFDGYLIEAE